MTERAGLLRRMTARDPDEQHRASTPLELLFDLTLVVAVSQVAAELHHAIAENHLLSALPYFFVAFFAIWWAWMNFTWFASAYDTDDVLYRVLTLLQMGGVLVLAGGVPAAFNGNLGVIVLGYVIMRVAMIGQWLRAARQHPESRATTMRYAIGIVVVQAAWVGMLFIPKPLSLIVIVILILTELAGPVYAEAAGTGTTWHPGHIAERYGLFTIIVLGEVLLSTLLTVREAIEGETVRGELIAIGGGALVIVFALWWFYFLGDEPELKDLRTAVAWGYGHYFLFGSVAALGAGVGAAVDIVTHHGHASELLASMTIAVSACVFMVVLAVLHAVSGWEPTGFTPLVIAAAVVVLAAGSTAAWIGLGGSVLAIAAVLAITLGVKLFAMHRVVEA
ncbi:low temperature requirement protein A [Smaragdicoccus niigatensis]|uniref:low temperature requirement protein A n=1 Tax=Smaragdicoccus niigatensis TaxID=359359 RepID=UPI00058D8390|nr:low temperature requirement protein A [Smaragdicoccus niigatensis]